MFARSMRDYEGHPRVAISQRDDSYSHLIMGKSSLSACVLSCILICLLGCAGQSATRPKPSAVQAPVAIAKPAPVAQPAASSIQLVSAETKPERVEPPKPVAEPQWLSPPTTYVPPPVPEAKAFDIDLPTALRLADAGNYQVEFAREQIRQAWARVEAADALWLPSIRVGADYNKHEGQIQDITGNVFPTSRGNLYTGLGAAAPSAASPTYPGLYANFHLADALFQPLAARQAASARRHAAMAMTNDTLLKVSLGYLELLRASEDLAIASQARGYAQELADLTKTYAHSGQGLQADAERAIAELAIRKNDVHRAGEAARVASARLAQLLRLDPMVQLDPAEPTPVPIELVPPALPAGELVAQGLSGRPELGESRHLVAQAVEKMRRERFAALIPSVVLGVSYGGFGGGLGGAIGNFSNRMDADAIAFWEIRNLGLGDRAARAETRSLVRQANVNQLAAMDLVAREVVEAHAQVTARREQIAVAKEGVEAALKSHERNLERIRNVQGLPIEVLQSNQALAQTQREYLRTVVDYNAAQFALFRALGCPIHLNEQGGHADPIANDSKPSAAP